MKRFVFVAAYGLACLGLLEGALQAHYRIRVGAWLPGRTALPIFAPDEHSGFRLRPHVDVVHATGEFRTRIVTDGNGFRVPAPGYEHDVVKPEGAARVLLLGPSFAFGWGVDWEDTFLRRLGDRLGGDVELLNAGVPALGPVQQLAWFEARGRAYEPDLVLQLVYGSLVVGPEYSEGYRVDGAGYLVPRDRGILPRLRGEAKRSATVFYAWRAWSALRSTGSDVARVEGAGRPLSVSSLDPDDAAVGRALGFYRELERSVTRVGARLVVVYLPMSYTVHPEDLPRWRHHGVSDPRGDRERQREMVARLRGIGVDCVDLTDDLVRAAEETGDRLYYPIDIHWTPLGNAVAARTVAEHLLASGTGGVRH